MTFEQNNTGLRTKTHDSSIKGANQEDSHSTWLQVRRCFVIWRVTSPDLLLGW